MASAEVPPLADVATPVEPEVDVRKMKDDPRFAKYYKMEKVGVPRPQVAQKFAMETGLDPGLLDTPDAPAPPGGEEEEEEGEEDAK